MVLSSRDWKNQPRNILNWITVVIALVLISIHLYQGWIDGGANHYGISIFLVVWLVVFFTDYWQPILYLLTAVAVALITMLLFLGGYWQQLLDQAAILLTAVFLLLMVYLFFIEDRPQ